MEPMDWLPTSDVDLIGSATSIEGVIGALTTHGCSNLTQLIDLRAFSEFPLAGGGYCDVYQGALKNGTRIALKSLRVCSRSEETIDIDRQKVLKRAAREMYCWSKMQHSNVLPLLGFTVFRGHLSMVSEWMHNGNLMAYRNRNPGMGWVKPCMEICAGLRYIHAAGIVHGDLKAANVMVSSNRVAVISDFGNTQIKDLTLEFTGTTGNGISLRWAAPELLLRDKGPEMSKEADVYAYGMTVLEVITGKVPYEGIADHRVLALVAYEKQPPPRPDTVTRNEVWAILTSCWDQEPSNRPTIDCVSDRLQALFQLSHTDESPRTHQLDSGFMKSRQNNSSRRIIRSALNDSARPVDTSNLCETDNKGLNDGEMLDQEKPDEEMDELANISPSLEMSTTPPRPTAMGNAYPRDTPSELHSTSTDDESDDVMSISGNSLHSTHLSARITLASIISACDMAMSGLSRCPTPTSDMEILPSVPTSPQCHWTIDDEDEEESLCQLETCLSGVSGLLRQSRMLDDFAMGGNQGGAEHEWIRMRRATMCVREIVRTEKDYLRHLIGFRDSQDASSMPPILAEHLPRLIATSRIFCYLLDEDPSAWGVSQAFLDTEGQFEAMLVQWSSVVGEVVSSSHHRTASQATSKDGHTSSEGSSWTRRRSADQTKFPLNLSMVPVDAVASKSKTLTYRTGYKKFAEQDVVIAPTSRMIRYVHMYQELLFQTSSTSASRRMVERALQAATGIARKFDEAQNHADRIPSP